MNALSSIMVDDLLDSPQAVRRLIAKIVESGTGAAGRVEDGASMMESVKGLKWNEKIWCNRFDDVAPFSDDDLYGKGICVLRDLFRANAALAADIKSGADFDEALALLESTEVLMCVGLVRRAMLEQASKSGKLANLQQVVEHEILQNLPDRPHSLNAAVRALGANDLTHDETLARFRGVMGRYKQLSPGLVAAPQLAQLKKILTAWSNTPTIYKRLANDVFKHFDLGRLCFSVGAVYA